MSRQSRQAHKLDAIRSVSLEDIVHGRHTRWRKFVRKARRALIAVSLIGLTAATGGAVYQVLNGAEAGFPSGSLPGKSIEFATASPARVTTGSPPAASATSRSVKAEAAALAALEPISPSALESPAPVATEPVDVARLPAPRPAEPTTTGSIAPPVRAAPQAAPPRAVEERRFRPCRALQRLTARLPLPHISCVSGRKSSAGA